jgi:hypothetical protein
MKRQKNYRQLRSKSAARNRLNEIKSRPDVPVTRHSDATVQAPDKSLFDEHTEKPAYGEPPEDRFGNTPLPDFQFDWDEEFFGTASPDSHGMSETNPFERQEVDEEPVTVVNEEVKQDADSVIKEDVTAVNISESVAPATVATVETVPDQLKVEIVAAAPARFVSVKRQKAMTAMEAEKMKKPQQAGKTEGNAKVRTKTASRTPATGISGAEKKSEAPALNVRRAPSFRSFVISTIHRLMEEQRFLISEPESTRFLSRELGTGKREEPAASNTGAGETGQGGTTRWDKPYKPAASKSLSYNAGAKLQKSYSSRSANEKPSATRSSKAGDKTKPAPGSYQLNAARFTLMEAMINAKAISGNMRMKW